MPDYKKLYHKAFNAITDEINNLIKIQQDLEEAYLKSCEEDDKRRRVIRLTETKMGN